MVGMSWPVIYVLTMPMVRSIYVPPCAAVAGYCAEETIDGSGPTAVICNGWIGAVGHHFFLMMSAN